MLQYKAISSFKTIGSIIGFNTFDNSIYVFDSNCFISKIPLDTSKNGFKSQIVKNPQSFFYEYSKNVSIGTNLDCIVSLEKSKKLTVISLADDKILKKSSIELTSPVIYNTISSSSNFIGVATENGDFLLFENKDGSLTLFERFEKMGDYASSVTINKDDLYLYVSFFNKNSFLYDINKRKILKTFTTKDVVEKSLFSPDGHTLVCLTRKGWVEIIDVQTSQHIYTNCIGLFWPSDAVFLNEESIIVSTREGSLLLFDIIEQWLVDIINFETPISKLHIDKDILFISFCDGRILLLDIGYKIDEFLAFVKINNLERATKLLDSNLFLQLRSEYKQALKDDWNNKLKDVSMLLAKGQTDAAYDIAKPYLTIPSISESYQLLLSQTAEVTAFFDALDKKDYTAAYKIAYSAASIQKLPAFEALERLFYDCLQEAIKILEEDYTEGKQVVIKKLRPFAGVAKKRVIIEDIIKNWSNYEKATNLFKAKKFKEFFMLCENSHFLKECKLYKKAYVLGQNMTLGINNYEAKKEYENAQKLAKLLYDFIPFREIATNKIKVISLQIQLSEYIAAYRDDESILEKIFKLIAENAELENSDIFIEFIKELKEHISNLYNHFINNNSHKAEEKLDEYKTIPYLKEFIESLESMHTNISFKKE